MRCYRKILHISYKDHVTNEEVRAKIQQAIGPHEVLLTIVKRCKMQWYGHVSRLSGLAKAILQGTVKRGRRQGRQRKRWEYNIREWSGLEFGKSQRAVENREKWRKLVAKSSVVPQRPSRLRDWWWWWWWWWWPTLYTAVNNHANWTGFSWACHKDVTTTNLFISVNTSTVHCSEQPCTLDRVQLSVSQRCDDNEPVDFSNHQHCTLRWTTMHTGQGSTDITTLSCPWGHSFGSSENTAKHQTSLLHARLMLKHKKPTKTKTKRSHSARETSHVQRGTQEQETWIAFGDRHLACELLS